MSPALLGPGGVEAGPHPRVNGREEDIDQRGACEQRVNEAKHCAEHDAAMVDGGEHRVVAGREQVPKTKWSA